MSLIPITTIDITPEGCKTPEGAAKVRTAQTDWDDATHALANALIEFLDTHEDDLTAAMDTYEDTHSIEGWRDDLHQLRALIGGRNRKQEAFLRAVAGQ